MNPPAAQLEIEETAPAGAEAKTLPDRLPTALAPCFLLVPGATKGQTRHAYRNPGQFDRHSRRLHNSSPPI